jgi:pilus assembly protein CpaF
MASAIHIVLQQNRLVDGSRKVVSIAEVRGQADGRILLEDIFVYQQTGLTADGKVVGYHMPTGVEPQCLPRLRGFGVQLPADTFVPVASDGVVGDLLVRELHSRTRGLRS